MPLIGPSDPVVAQGGEEGERAPSPVRYEALAAPASPVETGHVGLGPGLVDKDQPARVKPALMHLPPLAAASYVGPVLLGGEQAFF